MRREPPAGIFLFKRNIRARRIHLLGILFGPTWDLVNASAGRDWHDVQRRRSNRPGHSQANGPVEVQHAEERP